MQKMDKREPLRLTKRLIQTNLKIAIARLEDVSMFKVYRSRHSGKEDQQRALIDYIKELHAEYKVIENL